MTWTVYHRITRLGDAAFVAELATILCMDETTIAGIRDTDALIKALDPGWKRVGATLTEQMVGKALAQAAQTLGQPRRVAVISDAQAKEIRSAGEHAFVIRHMRDAVPFFGYPTTLFRIGPLAGAPAHVVWLTADGDVPPLPKRPPGTAKATRRVQRRWNIASDLAAWVREESRRRGVAQGVVVEDALASAHNVRLEG